MITYLITISLLSLSSETSLLEQRSSQETSSIQSVSSTDTVAIETRTASENTRLIDTASKTMHVALEQTQIEGQAPRLVQSQNVDSAYALHRIELDELSLPGFTLQDVLRRASSIQVRSAGGRASASTMSLRGSTANQVKVFIDGSPLEHGHAQAVDLSTLDMQAFEAVEIYRSHAPARFGIGAIGGVVHLISKSSIDDDKQLQATVGSFDFREALWQQTWGHVFRQRINLHYQEEEGDFHYTDDNLTPDNDADDVEKKRINNDFTSHHLNWSGQREFSDEQRLSWDVGVFKRNKGLAGPAKFQSADVRYKERHLNLKLNYADKGWSGVGSRFLTSYIYRNQRNQYLDTQSQLGLGAQDNLEQQQAHDLHFILEDEFIWGGSTLKLNLRHETLDSEEKLPNRLTQTQRRQQGELGWDGRFDVFSGRFELRPSLAGVMVENTFESSDDNDKHFTWALTGHTWLGGGFTLRAGVSRGIRQPGLSERFGDRGTMVGNADLVSESSLSQDVGCAWEGELLHPDHNIQTEITFFKSDRKNLIQMVFDSRGVGRSMNLGKGKVQGIEWSISAELPYNLSYGGHITRQEARQSTRALGGGESLKIPGIFEDVASAWIEWHPGSWWLRYDVHLAAEKAYDLANNITAGDQEEHNMALGYRRERWEVSGGITNLLDQQLEDFNNWPRPGRSLFVHSRFNF